MKCLRNDPAGRTRGPRNLSDDLPTGQEMETSTVLAMDHEALVAVLTHQRRLLEQLLFRHAELRLLIDAGEARFISNALGEIDETETELGTSEVLRAAIADELGSVHRIGPDPSLGALIDVAPDRLVAPLRALASDLRRLLESIEEHRAAGREVSARNAGRIAGLRAGRPDGYRSDGSAGLGA